MWTIVKFDKKKLNILKNDLTKKIGQNWKIYLQEFLKLRL